MSVLLKNLFQTSKCVLNVPNSCFHFCSLKTLQPPTTVLTNTFPSLQLSLVRCINYKEDSRVFRKIRGGGRPVPDGVTVPIGGVYGWRPVYPKDGKYTTRPLPIIKLGGRDPETGRVVVRTIGGGHKKKFRWVDFHRIAPNDGTTLEEKVYQVRYDPCRTARIALVASDDHKRWILASDGMKVGDIIRTSGVIPRMDVRPQNGDAYPLGALPLGTLIHNIEAEPGKGGVFCKSSGAAAQLLKKMDNKCIVQLPSKQQVLVDEKCMAVAGRVSNINHGSIPIGHARRLRWLGKRPVSGLWHRKDGYCGRKLHPPKGIKDLLQARIEKPEIYELTWKD